MKGSLFLDLEDLQEGGEAFKGGMLELTVLMFESSFKEDV